MKTVGAFEAKTHFSQLLSKVEQGQSVIITKHGRAVAKILPITTEDEISSAEHAAQKIRNLRKNIALGKNLNIKKLIALGRK